MTDQPPPSRSPLVHMEEGPGGLPRVRVANAHGAASVFLHGAHVSAWEPAGHRPVIWMSAESAFAPAKPIRGGVPICFPWFGPHRDVQGAPAHGFARLHDWTYGEATSAPDGSTTITFRLVTAADASRREWPHAAAILYEVTVGPTLDLSLAVENTDVAPFTYEAALHTYFAVSDVRQIAVTGLEGTEYLDKVDAFTRKRQPGEPIRFSGETDRVYLDTRATCTIEDPGWARRITVAKEGSDATVVWNPWIAKARAMPDFGDEEWTGMVCVETCNVGPHAVTLAPGARHVLRASLSVAPR